MPRSFVHRTFRRYIGTIVAGVVVGLIVWFLTERNYTRSSSDGSKPVNAPANVPASAPVNTPANGRPSPLEVQASFPPPRPPMATPRIPQGSFSYNRQVTVFGSGFYGRNTPLILQSVENHPGSRLSLHFLIENEDDADYYFTLLNPSETAVAIDDARGYYAFLSAEGIDSATPISVPAGGRRDFTVSFQPLTTPRRSLLVRLSFEQQRSTATGFSVQGQGSASPVRVEIPNIPLYKLVG